MHRAVLGLIFGIAAVAIALTFAHQPFGSQSEAAGSARVASAFGISERPSGDLIVHVSVLVPPGVASDTAIGAALAAQGARPARPSDVEAANYVTSGLYWDQFSDANPGNDFVTQYYNPANQPVDGQAVLQNTHTTWNNVPTSSFVFAYGGTTARCPSLVEECSGPQTFDGFNDVSYMALTGPCNAVLGCTLGVTWSGISIDEADMALNTKARWVHDCVSPGNRTDAETVILHENGHVLGLDHSPVGGSVMQAFYDGAQCTLGQDDVDGVSVLYPSSGTPNPTSTPTETPPPTATPTNGPAPTATPTSGGGASCPPGHHRRGLC